MLASDADLYRARLQQAQNYNSHTSLQRLIYSPGASSARISPIKNRMEGAYAFHDGKHTETLIDISYPATARSECNVGPKETNPHAHKCMFPPLFCDAQRSESGSTRSRHLSADRMHSSTSSSEVDSPSYIPSGNNVSQISHNQNSVASSRTYQNNPQPTDTYRNTVQNIQSPAVHNTQALQSFSTSSGNRPPLTHHQSKHNRTPPNAALNTTLRGAAFPTTTLYESFLTPFERLEIQAYVSPSYFGQNAFGRKITAVVENSATSSPAQKPTSLHTTRNQWASSQDAQPTSKPRSVEGVPSVRGSSMAPQTYDTERGFYRIVIGDHIHYRYEIIRALAKDICGTTVKAYDHLTKEKVIIKIARSRKRCAELVEHEIDIHTHLHIMECREENVQHTAPLLDSFIFRGHVCLVFVCDGKTHTLREVIARHQSCPGVKLSTLRRIAVSLIRGVQALHDLCFVHGDLRPENVTLHRIRDLVSASRVAVSSRIDSNEMGGPVSFENRHPTQNSSSTRRYLKSPYLCKFQGLQFGTFVQRGIVMPPPVNLLISETSNLARSGSFALSHSSSPSHCTTLPSPNSSLQLPKNEELSSPMSSQNEHDQHVRSLGTSSGWLMSRNYAAPEILLGIPHDKMTDWWSVGCILVELATGETLYGGKDDAEQLTCIMESLDVPPKSFIECSPRQREFFDIDGQPLLVDRTQRCIRVPNGIPLREEYLRDYEPEFSDFVAQFLKWCPEERLTGREALQHPFLTHCEHSRTSK